MRPHLPLPVLLATVATLAACGGRQRKPDPGFVDAIDRASGVASPDADARSAQAKTDADAIARADRTRRCDQGDGEACYQLGQQAETWTPAAVDLYLRACDHGHADGCLMGALAYLEGHAVARNVDHALALYQTTCDRDVAAACVALGHVHTAGTAVPRDPARAAVLFDRACQLGDDAAFLPAGIHAASGCLSLATLHETGDGVAKDPAKVDALYRRACTLGVHQAC